MIYLSFFWGTIVPNLTATLKATAAYRTWHSNSDLHRPESAWIELIGVKTCAVFHPTLVRLIRALKL
jgi:hypothetical protein